jgi:hypothetical protein
MAWCQQLPVALLSQKLPGTQQQHVSLAARAAHAHRPAAAVAKTTPVALVQRTMW